MTDADRDGATDDRTLTLPDGGTITLLNLGTAALVIDDFTFAVWNAAERRLVIVDPDPEGNGGAAEETQLEESILQQHLNLLKIITGGAIRPLFKGQLALELSYAHNADHIPGQHRAQAGIGYRLNW